MAVTFESLLQDIKFMKLVFAVMESVRHDQYLSEDDKHRLQRSVVESIYGANGVTITEDQYWNLVDYCKDAEDTVSELSDEEASMLAAGLNSLNEMKPSDVRAAADNLRSAADNLDGLAKSLV